jgi:hypothetical protein
LGMSRIGCPDISLFSGHAGRVRGTRPGTRGTCPQNGVPEALKNEDTGHENPRLRDTKDTLTNLSILMVKSLKQPSLNIYFKYLQHPHHPS